MKKAIFILFVLLVYSCSSSKLTTISRDDSDRYSEPYAIANYSTDESYGYTEENPIKVGGVIEAGPLNERSFLNSLTGPNGEKLSFYRSGSCCFFETENSIGGGGLLDIYIVTWKGAKEPVKIYINMYDFEEPKVPVGFKAKYPTSLLSPQS